MNNFNIARNLRLVQIFNPRRVYFSIHSSKNTFNPYKILGVSKTASQNEIKKAYISLVKTVHPDVKEKPEEDDKNDFEEIFEAYSVLRDPEERKKIDNKLFPPMPNPQKSSFSQKKRDFEAKMNFKTGFTQPQEPPNSKASFLNRTIFVNKGPKVIYNQEAIDKAAKIELYKNYALYSGILVVFIFVMFGLQPKRYRKKEVEEIVDGVSGTRYLIDKANLRDKEIKFKEDYSRRLRQRLERNLEGENLRQIKESHHLKA